MRLPSRGFLTFVQGDQLSSISGKTFWSCQILVFLGFLINTLEQTISVPIEKVQKAVLKLTELYTSIKTMVLKVQQLTGLLNLCGFCTWILTPVTLSWPKEQW